MRVIYIADDGTEFDDETECYEYEVGKKHPCLMNVKFFDKNGNMFGIDKNHIYAYSTYNNSEKIIIHDEDELKDFLWWSEACGWCEFYEHINAVGVWVRHAVDCIHGVWKLE